MQLTKKELRVLLAFSAEFEIRHSLNGLYFDGVDLVATNGHMMACLSDNSAKRAEKINGFDRVIQYREIKRLINKAKVSSTVVLTATSEGVEAELDGEIIKLEIQKEAIYPEYERVFSLLREGLPKFFCWYQPNYLVALTRLSYEFCGGFPGGFVGAMSDAVGMLGMDATSSDEKYRLRAVVMPMRM